MLYFHQSPGIGVTEALLCGARRHVAKLARGIILRIIRAGGGGILKRRRISGRGVHSYTIREWSAEGSMTEHHPLLN